MKKQRSQVKGVITGGWQAGNRATIRDMGQGGKGVLALPSTVLGPTSGGRLMEQRRQVGLCYKCGDKYFFGHKCRRQLLILEAKENKEEEVEGTPEIDEEDEGEISLHALKGSANSRIIKVEEEPVMLR